MLDAVMIRKLSDQILFPIKKKWISFQIETFAVIFSLQLMNPWK